MTALEAIALPWCAWCANFLFFNQLCSTLQLFLLSQEFTDSYSGSMA
jgi:hypothetical protein